MNIITIISIINMIQCIMFWCIKSLLPLCLRVCRVLVGRVRPWSSRTLVSTRTIGSSSVASPSLWFAFGAKSLQSASKLLSRSFQTCNRRKKTSRQYGHYRHCRQYKFKACFKMGCWLIHRLQKVAQVWTVLVWNKLVGKAQQDLQQPFYPVVFQKLD